MNVLFTPPYRQQIEQTVLSLLNNTQLMTAITANSPRAVGDAVQGFLEQHFFKCLPTHVVTQFNANFARRSMADFAFTDTHGNYYIVDNKTHNLDTKFNMPNLTSVERLSRFYGDNTNHFVLLLVSYRANGANLHFEACTFVPIEMLDWSCLTLGALGWGQIQIANSNIITINPNNTRKTWMLQLCDMLDIFYPNEIAKITQRIGHFQSIRNYWLNQPD